MGKLTQEERKLRTAVEQGEWRSMKDLEKQRPRYQGYARATLKKDRRINIRLSQKDLEALQTLAQVSPCLSSEGRAAELGRWRR